MSTWREITQVDSNTVWQLLASAQQSTGGLNPPSFLKPPISPVLAEEDQDDGTAFIFSKIYLSHRGQLVLQHSVLFYIFMFSWDLKATPLCSAGPWTWSTDGPGCVAVGGEGAGSQCHFPFTFEGVVYQGCAYKPEFVTKKSSKSQLTENICRGSSAPVPPGSLGWCSTKRDINGIHVNGPSGSPWVTIFSCLQKTCSPNWEFENRWMTFYEITTSSSFQIGMKRTTFISHHSDPQKYVGFCDNSCPSAWTTIACCSTARFHECPIKTFLNWGNIFPNSNLKIITY